MTAPSLRRRVRQVVAVVAAGLALYVVGPALIAVVDAWPRLSTLEPVWIAVMLAAEVASFWCSMTLLWIVVRRGRWSDVAAAGLAGNAVTNTLPGGDAVGAGVQYRMLARSGIDADAAAGGLTVSSVLGVAGLFFLPVFALPAVAGGAVSTSLAHAAYLGLAGFALIVVASAVALTTDGALTAVGHALEWFNTRLLRRRRADVARRLLTQRDLVRRDLGRNWWRASLLVAGRVGLDYASLLAALRATGAHPNPAAVLLAFAATALVALLPLTPGGLGLVEASLGGLLVLAGVPGPRAILATLAYRLGSYWLPILVGAAAYLRFRRRFASNGEGADT